MILEVIWDGLGTLSFGLSQFHGHGSWLVCEVALIGCASWYCKWNDYVHNRPDVIYTRAHTRLCPSSPAISRGKTSAHICSGVVFASMLELKLASWICNCVVGVALEAWSPRALKPISPFAVYWTMCRGWWTLWLVFDGRSSRWPLAIFPLTLPVLLPLGKSYAIGSGISRISLSRTNVSYSLVI